MDESKKRCMVCAKEAAALAGGICQPCQDRIRREAMGEQASTTDRANRELSGQGQGPAKR